MQILTSLRETETTLKIDVDTGPNWPEWWRLKTILNFMNFPDAKIYETAITQSHHLESSIPSQMKIRRAIPDCRGRIYCSERRFEMIGCAGDIIFWTGKAKFKYVIHNGRLAVKWTRKRKADRKITVKDLLHFPFKLSPPTHVKRTVRYLKRKKGEKIEEAKHARANLRNIR